VPVSVLTDAVSVSVAIEHALADGTLMAWGPVWSVPPAGRYYIAYAPIRFPLTTAGEGHP
jgi:hypothetical protein